MTRTYLYVDGENWTIRAAALDELLKKDPDRTRELANLANGFDGAYSNWKSVNPSDVRYLWSPVPHRDAFANERTSTGITYVPNYVYWDSIGLFIALHAGLYNRASLPIDVDKAYYFTSSIGNNIRQHTGDLHSLGFSPTVFPRVKPDAWVKQLAAAGITVVSRPKPLDILIATRILEDCMGDNFDRCIFVGGDADYIPLLEAVRRCGKEVWLVAIEKWLQDELKFASDRFIAYDPVLSVRPLPSPGQDTADDAQSHRT